MPIELVRNDLKYYLCAEVQPQKMKELMKGVIDSWKNELDVTIFLLSDKFNFSGLNLNNLI